MTDVPKQDHDADLSDANPPEPATQAASKATSKRKAPAKKAKKPGTKKRGESSTSPRRIKAIEEKQLSALEYRKLGYTYQQIADALEYKGAQGAHEAVKAALLKIIKEPAADVLQLEIERLDALFVKPYQNALNGDLMALSSCLSIMARKSRLLGLDAPVKSEIAGPNGGAIQTQVHMMTTDEMEAAAARLAEKY